MDTIWTVRCNVRSDSKFYRLISWSWLVIIVSSDLSIVVDTILIDIPCVGLVIGRND